MCTQWCVRFQKNKNPKIKKGGARLVRLFRILKISCSWLSGFKANTKKNNKKVSNTNDIRAREKEKKIETVRGRRKARFDLFFPRNSFSVPVGPCRPCSLFPFLLDYVYLILTLFFYFLLFHLIFYVFFNGYCNHLVV